MIRPGRIADLPEITRIRTAVTENHLSVAQMAAMGITHGSIAADLGAGHLACWVAMEGDVMTGFSMADTRDASIFALFMDRAHEGKGHGSALLAACEAWLAHKGHAEAQLSTERDSRAFGFYLRRGWREAAQAPHPTPQDATLTKALSCATKSLPLAGEA